MAVILRLENSDILRFTIVKPLQLIFIALHLMPPFFILPQINICFVKTKISETRKLLGIQLPQDKAFSVINGIALS